MPLSNKSILIKGLLQFLLGANFFISVAQNPEIDSLENLVATHKTRDTIRVQYLTEAGYKLWYYSPEKTLAYSTEALSISDSLGYTKGQAMSYRIIGVYHWSVGDNASALTNFLRSLELSRELDYKPGIAKSLSNVAMIYAIESNFHKAIAYHFESLRLKEQSADSMGISVSLLNIGATYYRMDKYEKSLEYYQKALEIKRRLNDEIGLTMALSNIGITLDVLGKKEEALINFEKALEYIVTAGNDDALQNMYNNIAALYHDLENYDKALEYGMASLKLAMKIEDDVAIAVVSSNLSSIYSKKQENQEALKYAKTALDLALKNNLPGTVKEASGNMAHIYAELGNHKEAYNSHVQFKLISDSLINEEEIRKITGLEYQYAFEKEKAGLVADQQRKELEYQQQLERKKWALAGAIGLVIMITLVAALAYRAYQIKQRANVQLSEKNERLKELRASEKKLSEEAMATKERELASMAMATHEKNALLKDLDQKVRFVQSRLGDEMKDSLKDMRKAISESYSLDESWDSFIHKFNDVHPQFFDKLKEQNPVLTIDDLKLSAYLKIGMSNKEIANVTHIALGSVKSKINRLKKKLEMGPTDNVRDYMMKYA